MLIADDTNILFQGAASPQAVKKLLALSEPPKVSRGPTKSPSTPPPPIHRRAAAGCNKALAVVDLTAESSSVTASCPTRKGHHHAQSGTSIISSFFLCTFFM